MWSIFLVMLRNAVLYVLKPLLVTGKALKVEEIRVSFISSSAFDVQATAETVSRRFLLTH